MVNYVMYPLQIFDGVFEIQWKYLSEVTRSFYFTIRKSMYFVPLLRLLGSFQILMLIDLLPYARDVQSIRIRIRG